MRRRHLRLLFWATCVAAGVTAFQVSRADAYPETDLEREAAQAEKAGHWTKARDCYEQLIAKDRNRTDYRKHFLRCHRMAALVQRHRDPTYRDQVEKGDLRTAFLVYRDVSTKLRGLYLNPEKTDFADLYQYGLEELRLALNNQVFRSERLPAAVSLDAVQSFRRELEDRWSGLLIQSQRELESEINRLAQAAKTAIELDPVVTVMEFACGACHGLDEFTLYLTPSQLAELYASVNGEAVSSVTDVRVFPEQPGIGYCHISSFQKGTPHELDDALLQLQMLGMKVLILDLRGNSGGYLPAAIQVTERFLPEGKVIVTTESHVPEEMRIYRVTQTAMPTLPLVVLVDHETASAAEVVAGAFHAHQRATLVGVPTYGKWSMQRVLELKSAGSAIRVTLARFLSPGSAPYTKKGIIPDVLEERSPISMADNQLLAAIQVALRLIEMPS